MPSRTSIRTSPRRDPRFSGGGSPSLRATLRDAARVVPDPNGKGSVYAEWRKAAAVADTAEPAMGDPGGGSDFAGFYNHLGIPIAEWGFGGAGGVYHSQYDDYTWMTKFGDPGFQYHAAAARVGAAMLLRLANADVLPYDYAEFAKTMRRYLAPIDRAVADHRLERADDRASRGDRPARARGRGVQRRARLRAGRVGAVDRDAAAHEPRADAGRARADSPARASDAPVVPQPHLRRGREQRLREHGVAVGERGDSRAMMKRSRRAKSPISRRGSIERRRRWRTRAPHSARADRSLAAER